MVPRPKDKRYCHVCEERFEDYLTVLVALRSISIHRATPLPWERISSIEEFKSSAER